MKNYWMLIPILFLFVFQPSNSNAQQKGDPMFQVPLGIASYTFRNHWENGVEETLDIIQSLGFTEFEGGAPAGVSPEDFKQMCAERGISIPSTGTGFDQLEKDPMAVADRAKALGASYVMCAWIPHKVGQFSKADADRAIQVFNQAGKVLKENGIVFKYHVHGYEFQPYEDATLLEYLIENTDPNVVKLQMDVMWTHFGGGDPAALLQKYGDRWVSLHLKDFKKGAPKNLTGLTGPENDVPLGEGELDFPGILKEANRIGIKHMFIEDESEHELEALPKSIAYLKSLRY
ncbi:sugar phosphate isomerase/epimerase [Algoriphagus kandeliae]|uniref:Sugar phosphate isomerase/epimerase n=1 Tax=Algoriphagus kandeliae TaxID=2562278 RepID=A0A4Y9QQC8_9BACT|nr:sugar phosphate isomerase/epimerase [Algoriphagus kandeliae]TFV93216.1 sugar phosphate isomerase/epimerase [Algoriphagus kandeliae]